MSAVITVHVYCVTMRKQIYLYVSYSELNHIVIRVLAWFLYEYFKVSVAYASYNKLYRRGKLIVFLNY